MDTGTHDPAIAAALDKLEATLPDRIVQYPDEADFWSAFAGEADQIAESASPDDSDYARGRIDCMLKNAGKIPGEDEGSPCRQRLSMTPVRRTARAMRASERQSNAWFAGRAVLLNGSHTTAER